ncbi:MULTISPECIES: DUF5606 family protein [Prevotellaceae]|jgi:hypothetical protein|uniref:DUF5606 domain-containing protein n=1 Tax=Xylanibacter rarus TaxID=1676614 RepID=A0A8E1USR1_9BACT|nr:MULTISPECIES: DUF5606 domain-containing protein [Prevotellaceae]KOO69383.1 hypothetical protein ACU52_03290 [Xylanibacter rarus]MBS5875341.1 DUF5606 domain-containing protein [Prevotella sp.]HJH77644.1 DUF5606 domain-containing protein [Prevotellaceae bacterium]
MKQTILSISGKPGLYILVSRGKANLIVEKVDETHKRMPVFASDCVTSLNDIAMYTNADDVPLTKILADLYKVENGGEVSIDYRKCPSKELRDHFAKVLPDFDQDRVHDSDIKKLYQWYNILVKNGITDFENNTEASAEENEQEG